MTRMFIDEVAPRDDATGSTTPALYAFSIASLACAVVPMKARPAAAMKAARGKP